MKRARGQHGAERRRLSSDELDADRDGAIDRLEFMQWWRGSS